MLYPMYKVTMGVNDYVELFGNHSEGIYRVIWWTRRTSKDVFHKRQNKSKEWRKEAPMFGAGADAVAYLFLLAGKRGVRKWNAYTGGYEPLEMYGGKHGV